MPPFNMMGGPPPGTEPQGLSTMMPPGAPPEPEGFGGAKPAGGAGGLKDVFDEVQGVLDALAGILPEQAAELDEIKMRLSEVLAKAISGGATFRGREGGGPTSPASPALPA